MPIQNDPWFDRMLDNSEEACEYFGVASGENIITPNGKKVTVIGSNYCPADNTRRIWFEDEAGEVKYWGTWENKEDFEKEGFKHGD